MLSILIALVTLLCIHRCEALTIAGNSAIANRTSLVLYIDPPNGHSSPAALGVFVRASDPNALVYYDENGGEPTLTSPYMTYDTPYIQLDTPFKAKRERVLTVVAVVMDENGVHRSKQYRLKYNVEGAARKNSFGFLVPGIESSGYFVRYGIEIKAKARAQVAGGQEFADFNTYLGIGTYSGVDQAQIAALNLLLIDPELQGFEGGFPGKLS
jgi:hypothetical protein